MKLTLSYQPLQLYPPFSYAAVFEFELTDSTIQAKLDIEYLGREELTDEELKAEGFTRSDDLSWNGNLNAAWLSDVKIFSTMEMQPDPDSETYLHIHFNGKDAGFPKAISQAEIRFHELMQVILESAEIEQSLQSQVSIDGSVVDVLWAFKKREVSISGHPNTDWEKGRELMQLIFNRDFESLKPMKVPSINSINPGDGNWYEIKEADSAKNIQDLINQLEG